MGLSKTLRTRPVCNLVQSAGPRWPDYATATVIHISHILFPRRLTFPPPALASHQHARFGEAQIIFDTHGIDLKSNGPHENDGIVG